MRRVMSMIVLGIGGLSLAIALSIGAFALAGNSLREPVGHVVLQSSSRPSAPNATASASSERQHETDSGAGGGASQAGNQGPASSGGRGGDD